MAPTPSQSVTSAAAAVADAAVDAGTGVDRTLAAPGTNAGDSLAIDVLFGGADLSTPPVPTGRSASADVASVVEEAVHLTPGSPAAVIEAARLFNEQGLSPADVTRLFGEGFQPTTRNLSIVLGMDVSLVDDRFVPSQRPSDQVVAWNAASNLLGGGEALAAMPAVVEPGPTHFTPSVPNLRDLNSNF